MEGRSIKTKKQMECAVVKSGTILQYNMDRLSDEEKACFEKHKESCSICQEKFNILTPVTEYLQTHKDELFEKILTPSEQKKIQTLVKKIEVHRISQPKNLTKQDIELQQSLKKVIKAVEGKIQFYSGLLNLLKQGQTGEKEIDVISSKEFVFKSSASAIELWNYILEKAQKGSDYLATSFMNPDDEQIRQVWKKFLPKKPIFQEYGRIFILNNAQELNKIRKFANEMAECGIQVKYIIPEPALKNRIIDALGTLDFAIVNEETLALFKMDEKERYPISSTYSSKPEQIEKAKKIYIKLLHRAQSFKKTG